MLHRYISIISTKYFCSMKLTNQLYIILNFSVYISREVRLPQHDLESD